MAHTRITLIAFLTLACGGTVDLPSQDTANAKPRAEDLVSAGPHEVAVLTVRGVGSLRFELYPELAPKTVEHFKKLANERAYDGTTFHRVIPGFMVQGGDPNSRDNDPRNDGNGGGAWLQNEFTDYSHTRGTISLANRGHRNSGGSQFFIVHQDSPHLDGRYSVFGKAIEGMDVIDAVSEVEIDTYGRYGPENRPHPDDVVIESVRIESSQLSQRTP